MGIHDDVQSPSPVDRFPRRRGIVLSTGVCIVILCTALVFVGLNKGQSAHAAGTFSQGTTSTGTSQALIWFEPSGWTAGYMIVHYTVGSGVQQNVNMTYNSSTTRWEYTVSGLSSGNTITYSFTYQLSGLQYDTGSYSYTFGSTSPTATATSGSGGGAGTFPLIMKNNTGGQWSDSQIYLTILGQATPNQWSYLHADGTYSHISHLDATASNHLTKNGVNYANMSFTLAQASTVTIPATWMAARLYISLGSPMYFPIASDDSGWGGPNLSNASDPNAAVYFDWYEFTYQYGVTAYGGNTTQVDMFGFPYTVQVQQSSSNYNQANGITLTRSQIYSQYATAVGSAFTSLASTYRILAPKSSSTFATGGSQANYMQSYIAQTWSYYTTNTFSVTTQGSTFAGKVVNGQLQFTQNGSGSYVLNEPTTQDVFACSGALANGNMTTAEAVLGAAFCAAFNRGVAMNTADWNTVSAYYVNSPHNDYAMFWHQVSINHLAYGFPYDDVNSQSSVAILPNTNPPGSVTISVGW
jgi:hypothetical protein